MIGIEIRPAEIKDISEILSVLNAASLALHQKGVNQWDYPWDENQLLEQLGFLYVVSVDGNIIGTFGIKDVRQWHVEGEVKYLYQIAIHPEYQGKGYGATLVSWACQKARSYAERLYLDCWAGNEKLKSFYRENGFDYVGDFPEEDYYISIFRCREG
ncbi:GNAT family N-acetyltransferase [Mesobacillus thioparans]|uniref:GNAT family N-acetyltransferase n=1 Tax=Mesobacillus thioparans TaxID=370439 RepID=UPI0039F13FA6